MYRPSKQPLRSIRTNPYSKRSVLNTGTSSPSNSSNETHRGRKLKSSLFYVLLIFIIITIALVGFSFTQFQSQQNTVRKTNTSSTQDTTNLNTNGGGDDDDDDEYELVEKQYDEERKALGATSKDETPPIEDDEDDENDSVNTEGQDKDTSTIERTLDGDQPEEDDETRTVDDDYTSQEEEISSKSSTKIDRCSFRTYQPEHYYFLDTPLQEQPDFLTKNTKYIRGNLPFVINPNLTPKKLCIDTSEWEDMEDDKRPFSDGQNPSIVSLQSGRIDRGHISVFNEAYGDESLNDMYLGLLLFGDSQCRWNLTKAELNERSFSPLEEPPTKRSMVLLMDKKLKVLDRSVLFLEHDARWGEKRLKYPKKEDGHGGYERSIVELDDARIFVHEGMPHVLYRNGPAYGYEAQVQNRIHFSPSENEEGKFEAYIKASETFTVCCGRNIAFISEQPNQEKADGLYALTWIDPVTVESVKGAAATKRRLKSSSSTTFTSSTTSTSSSASMTDTSSIHHRILKGVHKSSIHGTNGYMLPLESTSELLGIAHFHRPEGRNQSPYARHGHHYTHAFFTIRATSTTPSSQSQPPTFQLSRLSDEFVFYAPTAPKSRGMAADVIQFASGLDLVGSDTDGRLLISYGINDCEAASLFVEMSYVQDLLQEVPDGNQVVHLMEDLPFEMS